MAEPDHALRSRETQPLTQAQHAERHRALEHEIDGLCYTVASASDTPCDPLIGPQFWLGVRLTKSKSPAVELVKNMSAHEKDIMSSAIARAIRFATVLAFRRAKWLPNPMPRSLISYVEMIEDTPGEWSGNCVSQDIYSPTWSLDRIAEILPPLMEAQIVIEMAGGIAEAIHRGERNQPFWFATRHCGTSTDRQRATAVLTDYYHLTGQRVEKRVFAERASRLLLANWFAVDALATELIAQHGRLEGDQVERIIEHAG